MGVEASLQVTKVTLAKGQEEQTRSAGTVASRK